MTANGFLRSADGWRPWVLGMVATALLVSTPPYAAAAGVGPAAGNLPGVTSQAAGAPPAARSTPGPTAMGGVPRPAAMRSLPAVRAPVCPSATSR